MSDTMLPENVASALLNAGSGLQEETGSSSCGIPSWRQQGQVPGYI